LVRNQETGNSLLPPALKILQKYEQSCLNKRVVLPLQLANGIRAIPTEFRIHSDLFRSIVIEYNMRRVNAIALLLFYLLANTELVEIVRLPILFEHFAEHKQQNKDIRFLDFIVLHYFSSDVKDADYERDQQLPFRGVLGEELSAPFALPVGAFEGPLPRIPDAILKVEMYVSRFHSSLFQFTIWQPPKA